MNTDDLTADQQKQIADLKAIFPYRIVFGCLHPTTGEFETHAVHDRRRYLCVVVSINNTTFQQTRKYEFLPTPEAAFARAVSGETIMDLEPLLCFGPEVSL